MRLIAFALALGAVLAAPRSAEPYAPSQTPWKLGDQVRYVVPEGKWLLVTDLGRSAGLSVRANIGSNTLFLSSGETMGRCIGSSDHGVPCPPGSTVVAEPNSGVRGLLVTGPLESGTLPKDVLAQHALINPAHRPSAHVASVPRGYRLHLTQLVARQGSEIQLLVDGEQRASIEGSTCSPLSIICEAGEFVELGTSRDGGIALGAVFGYYEALPGTPAALAQSR